VESDVAVETAELDGFQSHHDQVERITTLMRDRKSCPGIIGSIFHLTKEALSHGRTTTKREVHQHS
jgi:hypothetical protein